MASTIAKLKMSILEGSTTIWALDICCGSSSSGTKPRPLTRPTDLPVERNSIPLSLRASATLT